MVWFADSKKGEVGDEEFGLAICDEVVDDEFDSIHVLKNLLQIHCPEVEIVGEADGVSTALQVIKKSLPDLLLLDIAMNNENAFVRIYNINYL